MDINSLLDSLTEEDIEKLKATAAQFMGGSSGTDAGEKNADENKKNIGDPFGNISPDMLSAVAKVTGAMNQRDARCDFIAALKPLLSAERGKKADDAVMMLKFIRILEAMKGNLT